jgi:hypothetical protein
MSSISIEKAEDKKMEKRQQIEQESKEEEKDQGGEEEETDDNTIREKFKIQIFRDFTLCRILNCLRRLKLLQHF